MIAVMLFMLVGGIAFSQAVSDPRAVTLQWLRLGGITSVALLSIVAVALARDNTQAMVWGGLIATFVATILQLITTQLGRRQSQRWFAILAFVLSVVCVGWLAAGVIHGSVAENANDIYYNRFALPISGLVATALVGGYLMTMLLGHAYLTAGSEMTQAPFRRLVRWLGALLVVRVLLCGGFGFVMLFWKGEGFDNLGIWKASILVARVFVGLVVPLVFTWMIYDCVKRRANQSATGILYVASLLVIIGEWAAVSLWESTGWIF